MHTRKIENTDFHYNSDGSGMVEIVHYPVGTTEAKRVEVPFDHLLDFVGTFLQDAEVDHIQGMEPKDYLMRRY